MKTKSFCKKLVAFALAVAVVIGLAPASLPQTLAAGNKTYSMGSFYNETYFDSYEEAQQKTASITADNIKAAKEDGYLNDKGETVDIPRFSDYYLAVEFLRKCMVERRTDVQFEINKVAYSEDQYVNFILEIFDDAFAETTHGNEGDYLRYNIAGFKDVTMDQIDSDYSLIHVIDLRFMSSAYEEKKIEEKFEKLKTTKFKDWQNHKDVYNVRRVYQWVLDNFTYDYSLQTFSAVGGILYGSTVCQGYATTMYRFMKDLGIDNRLVASKTHAWNIVKIGSKYYHIDATWGDSGDQNKYLEKFFLKSYKGIRALDTGDNEGSHTLSDASYSLNGLDYTKFPNKYPISTKNYKYNTDSAKEKVTAPKVGVKYQTQVQSIGWQGWKKDGVSAGTNGEGKRLETIKIELTNKDKLKLGVEYRTHIQSFGWESKWKRNGAESGTVGLGKRLEAIQIRLYGADSPMYDIYYRVHAQSYGWLGWAKNGECAGTAGQGKRLEAIQIKVVKKGSKAPSGTVGYSYIDYGKTSQEGGDNSGLVNYRTHVQSYGWQEYVSDGSLTGTMGEGKRLEAIQIKLGTSAIKGSVKYRTHIQSIGWQSWKKNGELSGTSGQGKRLEAIEIELTGNMAKNYDIYYRVHAQSYGWLGWAKNGETAGTSGLGKRLEALQIVLLPKGSSAPSASTVPPCIVGVN